MTAEADVPDREPESDGVSSATRGAAGSASDLAATADESEGGRPGPQPDDPEANPSDIGEAEAEGLKRRARWGVVLLLGRTVVLQVGVFLANLFLARLLFPAEFGVFAVVQFVLALFNFFGDAGLGAALIQRKEEPTQRQLASVFCAQNILSGLVVVLVWSLAGPICRLWEGLPPSAPWLLRALAVTLLLTTIRIMPTILMERHLQFGRLAALEIVITVAFYLVAVVMAAFGFGVWALITGVLVQATLGVALAFAMRPWRPSLALDLGLLKPIVKFGIPYQAKNVVGFANGAIAPVYAGAKLGVDAVGFINFAQGTAYFPLKLVEVMARVTFPLYSRLQKDKALLTETLGRSVHICAVGTMFMVAIFLGMGEPLIRIVYTPKWLPALPLLHVYAGAIAIGFLAPVFAAALDASGKPELFFRLSVGWTVLNWIIVPLTTPLWGMLGFAAGYVIHVVIGNVIVIVIMHRLFPGLHFFRRLAGSVAGGLVVWLLGAQVLTPWITGGTRLGFAVGGCAILYAAVALLVDRRGLVDALSIVPSKKRSLESEGRP